MKPENCYCSKSEGYLNYAGKRINRVKIECSYCFDQKHPGFDPGVDIHQLKKDREEFEEATIKFFERLERQGDFRRNR